MNEQMVIEFCKRIEAKDVLVGIYGLGYVGLPLSLTFAAKGIRVLGFDIDKNKVEQIRCGESYFNHIDSHMIESLVRDGVFAATSDFSRTEECDALIVCVPTPLTANREPDLSYVIGTTETIALHLRKGQLFCLESTTYPGTSEEVILPILEKGGMKAGKDFFMAYSPEREDPGNKNFTTHSIPKLVGGYKVGCTKVATALYGMALEEVVPVSSCSIAEAAKLLENIYRAVNIAMVNELKTLFIRMGIDVWEVIEAAKTKPFGFNAFYPGPGLGGHCIPIDPFYLTWKARQYELNTRFIELAGEVNTAMPEYVISRVSEALNEVAKPIKGSDILVLGVAYKRDVDDMRESPSIVLIELLKKKGAKVRYNDPLVKAIPPMRDHALHMQSQELSKEILTATDCVLIATDHTAYDYEFIGRHAPLIVDTRNTMAAYPQFSDNVWKA